jgi:hypothetical protein
MLEFRELLDHCGDADFAEALRSGKQKLLDGINGRLEPLDFTD